MPRTLRATLAGTALLGVGFALGACGRGPVAAPDARGACYDRCARHESEWYLACKMKCDDLARAPALGDPRAPNAAPLLAPGAGSATLAGVLAKPAVVDLAAGGDTTCAVTSDGLVRCWGDNDLGQIGGKRRESTRPAAVLGVRDAVQVSVGAAHVCARTKDGGAICWGSNYSGELGVGDLNPREGPQKVPGLANVTQIAAGFATCALLADGTVTCWGDYDPGAGDPRSIGSQAPVAIPNVAKAVEVAVGGSISCARLQSGAVSCWRHISPGLVPRGKVRADPYAVRVTDAARIALDARGAAVTTAGTVKCWGDWGACAFDLARDGQGPQDWAATYAVPKLDHVAEVATSADLACARLTTGAVVCEESGKKGRRDVGVAGARKLVVGADHACALLATEVVCWGRNDHGQLGDGTTKDRPDPRPVAF